MFLSDRLRKRQISPFCGVCLFFHFANNLIFIDMEHYNFLYDMNAEFNLQMQQNSD